MIAIKKNIVIIAIIMILCYLCGLAGLFKPFILLLATAYYGLCFVIFSTCAYLVSPKSIKKKYAGSPMLFHLLLLICCVLLFLARHEISANYMADSVSLYRRIAKALLFLYTIFVGWNLLNKPKGKIAVIGVSIYVLFILCGVVIGLVITGPNKNDHESIMKNLAAIGYVQWVPTDNSSDKSSVVKHDPKLAFPGYNLYCGNESGLAILIDNDGNKVHEWNLNSEGKYTDIWPLARMCDNGDLVAYCQDSALIRYGWNSEQKWEQQFRPHHDIVIDGQGDIYLPSRKDSVIRMWGWVPVPVLDDLITIVSPNGEIKSNTRMAQAASSFITASSVADIYKHLLHPKKFLNLTKAALFGKFAFISGSPFDVLHVNSVDFLDRNIEGLGKKGDLIVSMRVLDMIAVIDPVTNKFIWTWGPGQISGQHNAKILENDNILLFDNGVSRGYSRAIELNPITFEIEWEYKAPEPKDFYSYRRSGCQRLPNGNTLITESDKGHVFEVTPSGQIVWDFYQPEMSEDKKTRRSIRYMYRIPLDSSALKRLKLPQEK